MPKGRLLSGLAIAQSVQVNFLFARFLFFFSPLVRHSSVHCPLSVSLVSGKLRNVRIFRKLLSVFVQNFLVV